MNQREDYHEAIKIKDRLDEECGKVTQDSVLLSKFDNEQVNHSLGTMKELKESTPKKD